MHSRMLFVRAYPRETQVMVFDAHDRVFGFFKAPAPRGIVVASLPRLPGFARYRRSGSRVGSDMAVRPASAGRVLDSTGEWPNGVDQMCGRSKTRPFTLVNRVHDHHVPAGQGS